MKKRSLPVTIILSIVLYIVSTGISYGFFNFIGSRQADTGITSPIERVNDTNKSRFVLDPSVPRTEVCPLNGMYYSKKEKEIWDHRRPLAIMMSNAGEGRPVWGLSVADIVYEAVAEGGVTRFMPIYLCGASLGNIQASPIRSARTHFITWVSEYDALYNHVGESNRLKENESKTDAKVDADTQIVQWGIKDLDQFGLNLNITDPAGNEIKLCWRYDDRIPGKRIATEHTMICETDALYLEAAKRGWTDKDEEGVSWEKSYTSWKFKEDAKLEDRPESLSVSFGFWEDYHDYDVVWDYDKQSNTFIRTNGGIKQIDPISDLPIQAKNVVVQFVEEEGPIDENKHMYYETIGEGEAIIFQDGKAIKGTWVKKNRLARTIFSGANGKEIQFIPGQIWIEAIPLGNKVTY